MQVIAENHHFMGALVLAKNGVPYDHAMSMTYETVQEHVRALATLDMLNDAEAKAMAPFLDKGT